MILSKKYIFSILLIFSNLVFANESTKEIIIPFTYPEKGYLPIFTVTDEEGRTLNLIFDSGYNYCALFPSILDKIENGKELLEESTIEYLKTLYPNKNENWLRNTANSFIQKNMMSMTIKQLKCNNFSKKSQTFTYSPNDISKNLADGIVGIDFFNPKKNIIIDYINKNIIIDGRCINAAPIIMEKEEIGLYSIPVTIDNITQTAIIDTGAERTILRYNYQIPDTELSHQDKKNFIYNRNDCKDMKRNMGYTNVNIQVGSSNKKIKAYKSGNLLLKSSVYGKRTSYVYNILGYDFYSTTCIQFDFENNEFKISEDGYELFN